jgi:hypothetical protein
MRSSRRSSGRAGIPFVKLTYSGTPQNAPTSPAIPNDPAAHHGRNQTRQRSTRINAPIRNGIVKLCGGGPFSKPSETVNITLANATIAYKLTSNITESLMVFDRSNVGTVDNSGLLNVQCAKHSPL